MIPLFVSKIVPKIPVEEAARIYTRNGLGVIPVPYKEKGPRLNDWPNLRIEEEDIPTFFNGEPLNIGVLLGEPSNGLTDIDLDCIEAVKLAPVFLGETWMFGRASKQRSHWIFNRYGRDPNEEVHGHRWQHAA